MALHTKRSQILNSYSMPVAAIIDVVLVHFFFGLAQPALFAVRSKGFRPQVFPVS